MHDEAVYRTAMPVSFLIIGIMLGCSNGVNHQPPLLSVLSIAPQNASLRLNDTLTMTAQNAGTASSELMWSIFGGSLNGSISSSGVYTPPATMPMSNTITVIYGSPTISASTTIILQNPLPAISQVSPATLTALSSKVEVVGANFVPGAMVTVDGNQTPTTWIDSTHLITTVVLAYTNLGHVELAVSNPDPGAANSTPFSEPVRIDPLTVYPSLASLRLADSLAFNALRGPSTSPGGTWSVAGGKANGTINPAGLYTAPNSLPNPNLITVSYQDSVGSASSVVTLLNPIPKITQISPAILARLSTPVVVTGSGFVPGSSLSAAGAPVGTTYVDASHLSAVLDVASSTESAVQLSVTNPAPGTAVSGGFEVPVMISPLVVSPSMLTGGNVTITATLDGPSSNATLTLDGAPLSTISRSGSSITASGYLPFWRTGSVLIAASIEGSSSTLAEAAVPIAPTAVSYDVAARFAMQAGFGPRHDVIEHIQKVGLSQYVDEQILMPPDVYTNPADGRRDYMLKLVNSNTQLRFRAAWAFQSIMPGRGIFQQQSVLPWEETLEAHAFGNFRQLLLDTCSDPNVTTLLNLPGNAAPEDPSIHPNQNFAREMLQLFSTGTVMLNDDGTVQTDSAGNPTPAYSQDTVLAISRALTGWTYATPTNPAFTAYGIDYSEKLVPVERQHDHGSKLIFGRTSIPGGQTTTQDRDQVLDAVFAHPNVPPFIARRLIQRFVKNQPSSAYVLRIAKVFKDDGNGVRGNLSAVIKSILLDSEAREGDTLPATDDGYIQDPFFSEVFAMMIMNVGSADGTVSYVPDHLSEPWWFPPTVFGNYSPDYVIPGTNLNSPEFQLLTSIQIVQRSEVLWGMINGTLAGFPPWTSTWLSQTFPTVPAMVDALNHLLYHGAMPATEMAAIISYCNGLPDSQTQLRSALFLALNGDAYTVVQ